MRYAIGWLRANIACSGTLTLCHGDYRIGNFMLADGTINGIFDWELAHVSDPVEDIAYSGLPLFRGRNPLLSQLLEPETFFARYEERTGLRVEPGGLPLLDRARPRQGRRLPPPRLARVRGRADRRPEARRDGPPGAVRAAPHRDASSGVGAQGRT